ARFPFGLNQYDPPDAIHMAAYQMSADQLVERQAAFKIDPRPRFEIAEDRAPQRLLGDVHAESATSLAGHGHACAVYRNRIADADLRSRQFSANRQHGTLSRVLDCRHSTEV